MSCRDIVLCLHHNTNKTCKAISQQNIQRLCLCCSPCSDTACMPLPGKERSFAPFKVLTHTTATGMLNVCKDNLTLRLDIKQKPSQKALQVRCRDSEIPGDFKIIPRIPPRSSSQRAQAEKPDAWQEWPRGQAELQLSDPLCGS